jgi:hypothetical protein
MSTVVAPAQACSIAGQARVGGWGNGKWSWLMGDVAQTGGVVPLFASATTTVLYSYGYNMAFCAQSLGSGFSFIYKDILHGIYVVARTLLSSPSLAAASHCLDSTWRMAYGYLISPSSEPPGLFCNHLSTRSKLMQSVISNTSRISQSIAAAAAAASSSSRAFFNVCCQSLCKKIPAFDGPSSLPTISSHSCNLARLSPDAQERSNFKYGYPTV